MTMAWYIPFIKNIFMNIAIIYCLLKITNNRIRNITDIFKTIILIILFSLVYVTIKGYFSTITAYLIYYFLVWITIFELKRLEIVSSIIIIMITISIALLSLFLASTINFVFMKLLDYDFKEYSVIECISIGTIQIVLIYLLFKIKRFKDGFSFIKKGNEIKIRNKFGAVISISIVFIGIMLGIFKNNKTGRILAAIFAIIGVVMFYWIKKNITKHYKQKMKDRTVEILEDSIKEKDEEINELKDELSKALEINHKYNHRLSAMEKAVASLGDAPSFNEEFAKEYSDVLDSLKEFSEEYKKEVELLNKHDELPKTKIFSIDNLLEYMKSEAENNKIEFKLEVNIDVNELINSKIEKCKLETMLADHIRDAIIAIISNEKANNGRIKVIFDKIEECFEVHVLDNGIEFEINTLLKLGLKPVTTHKISGGSGIGFMTTFNTLDDTKASLIIREFDASKEQDYTKDIVIRFDEKNEYVIESYRSEEIKIKDKENRIIIKEI